MNTVIKGWSTTDSHKVRSIIDLTLRRYGTTIFLDALADVIEDRVVTEPTPFWSYFRDRLAKIHFSGPAHVGVD